MGTFSERVQQRREAQAQAEEYEKRLKEFAERVERAAAVEDEHQNAKLQTTLRKRFQIYAEVATGEQVAVPPLDPRKAPDRSKDDWDSQTKRDRQQNVLFWLYKLENAADDPDALDREAWNEMVAAKGLLVLLTRFPQGEAMLKTLYGKHEKHTAPTRNDAEKFLELHSLKLVDESPRGTEHFLAELFRLVPGSQRALYRILASYRQQVRVSWKEFGKPSGAYLPEDDEVDQDRVVTWDEITRVLGVQIADEQVQMTTRMDRAIAAVLSGKSQRQAAKECRVGRDQLRKRCEELGIVSEADNKGKGNKTV